MSRAFVSESDADPGQLPDRPISPHPNFVTRRGHARRATASWFEPVPSDRVRFGMRVRVSLSGRRSRAPQHRALSQLRQCVPCNALGALR